MAVITQSAFYNKYKGKYIKIGGSTASSVDWNGTNGYAGQCATLGREYLRQCYGYPNRSYGNGCDYVNIPKGKKLSKPENWCLIVWPVQSGLPYGHVAIYYNGKMISQNPNKVALMTIWSGKKYYIRPHKYETPKKPKPVTRPKPTIKGEKVMAKTHKYKVIVDVLRVRKIPSTKGSIYLTVKKGYTFKADSYIDSNGYRWLVVKYDGIKYFIAESTLKNKKSKYVKDIT